MAESPVPPAIGKPAAVIRVTVEDLETAEKDVAELPDGTYVLTCTEPAHVANVQHYPTKGTVVITIKGVTRG